MASVVKIVSPLTKDQQMDRSNVIANGLSVVEGNILKGSSVTVKSELEFNYLSTSIKKVYVSFQISICTLQISTVIINHERINNVKQKNKDNVIE